MELEGLSPEGSVRFYLPGYKVGVLARYKDGSMGVAPAFLDTLVLDVPAGQGHLVWRAPMQKGNAIRVLEPRMTQPRGGE